MGYDVSIPRAFSDKEGEFRAVLDSPLLPRPIAVLLEKYLSIVEGDNITIIREVIVECAKEMPTNYPALDDIQRASYNWIRNRINDKFEKLEPTAKMINEYVRKYFDSDNLLPSKNKAKPANWTDTLSS